MALSDDDVERQIAHMMAFIEREGNEKVEEIEAKAEEEFNIEKGKLVTEQRLKIMEYYDKKEKQVELQKKIQNSNMLNQARLRVLKAREDHIRSVLEEARNQLQLKTRDQNQYKEVVKNLILQGLYQLIEGDVSIRCRQQDVGMIEGFLGSIATQYSKDVGKNCKVTIDKDVFLPSDCAGGVELYTQKGKIKISNTLESRLEMISQQLLPEIREALFGANMNRKFKD